MCNVFEYPYPSGVVNQNLPSLACAGGQKDPSIKYIKAIIDKLTCISHDEQMNNLCLDMTQLFRVYFVELGNFHEELVSFNADLFAVRVRRLQFNLEALLLRGNLTLLKLHAHLRITDVRFGLGFDDLDLCFQLITVS